MGDIRAAAARKRSVWPMAQLVMKPVGYTPGKKYPGILNTHGGPHGFYNDAFVMEHQRWANEGYFVFFCNPRGSTSYGLDFMNVTGRLGEEDFHNVMAFTDAVLAAYPDLDPERLAITGQSYGGFMTQPYTRSLPSTAHSGSGVLKV